jgi:glycerophosphoryl diester phosphodiesterase
VLYVVARLVTLACVLVFGALVVFDAEAERFTSGKRPAEFSRRLQQRRVDDFHRVIGVAHNAGDTLRTATAAAAYGVDAIEIDVRSSGSELFAAHDAPLPFLEDLVFRGPSLEKAWAIASLRSTVLLHLKEHEPAYLAEVHAFLAAHPPRHVIVQTTDAASLRIIRRSDPRARRLLLITRRDELTALQRDPATQRAADGVSVRDDLLTPAVFTWLKRHHLAIFAWTVDDPARMDRLVRAGVDGIITEDLDIMRLLGTGQRVADR